MKKRRIRYDRIIVTLTIIIFFVIALIIVSRNRYDVQDNSTNASTIPTETQTYITTTISDTTSVQTATTTEPIYPIISQIDYPECKSSVLYSVDDTTIIYSDTIHQRIAPASLTKLLTACVALKYADTDTIYTVGSEQWLVSPYSSLCYLQTGNMLSLEDLITGMLMASGNDAAYTIAVSVARELNPDKYMSDDEAVQYFCSLMNDFASELGMTNSNFVNPDGWDNEEQYTTAEDLIKLAEYVITVPKIMEITGTYQKYVTICSGESYSWTNSNLLIDPYSNYYCENAVGLKTGTTLNAGNSLIAVFKVDGKMYISVVLGCLSDNDRYELTLKLISNIKG